MNLPPSARRTFLRACWMTGSAVGALVVTSSHARAQEATSYSYDALGRLVSTSTSGGPNSGVVMGTCFDAAGNRAQYVVGAAGAPCTTPTPSPTPTPTPTPTNTPPVAVADSTSFHCASYKTLNVLANDYDPDGNTPLSLVGVTASNPSMWVDIANSTSIQMAASLPGSYTVNYTVSDSLGATAVGSVSVTVTGNSNVCVQV
jgi:YD repeat-containing protein